MQGNKLEKKVYLLQNKIQNYAWGQKNKEAFIPQLLGIKPEKDLPYAELWIGAHTKAPCKIMDTNLYDLISKFPKEILGEESAKKFNNTLPFLMKVLTAGEALSIQAHPNKSQAEVLHKKDPEHYPDDNHKPEIAIALDDLTALVGFKSLSEMIHTLDQYPPIEKFVSENTISQLRSDKNKKESLKNFYSEIMIKSEEYPENLKYALNNLDNLISEKSNKSEADELYQELRKKYGNDVGLFSLYLFNLVHLQKGEAVFLKAGIPHAYLKGNIIECMANSDNVVRAGLTPKFKDIQTLVEILTYEEGMPEVIKSDSASEINIFEVPIPEFEIIQRNLVSGKEIEIKNNKMEIFIITEGKISIEVDGIIMEYKKGDTLLIPAFLPEYKLKSLENTTIYSTTIPE